MDMLDWGVCRMAACAVGCHKSLLGWEAFRLGFLQCRGCMQDMPPILPSQLDASLS